MASMPTMAVRARLGSLACMLAATLAGCGSAHTTASSPAARSPAGAAPTANATTGGSGRPIGAGCTGSQVQAAYGGTQGATGHLELTVWLRNVSGRPCAMRGYPDVRLLDGAGHTLAMRIRHGGGFFGDSQAKPRLVALRAGAKAAYGISFAVNNEYAGAKHCLTAAALMSRAPGTATGDRLSLRGRPRVSPCGGTIVLSPVYAR